MCLKQFNCATLPKLVTEAGKKRMRRVTVRTVKIDLPMQHGGSRTLRVHEEAGGQATHPRDQDV